MLTHIRQVPLTPDSVLDQHTKSWLCGRVVAQSAADHVGLNFEKQQPQDQQQRLTGSCDAGET